MRVTTLLDLLRENPKVHPVNAFLALIGVGVAKYALAVAAERRADLARWEDDGGAVAPPDD